MQRAPRGSNGKRSSDQAGGGKAGKGLRHFSMKVCEKVQTKGRTTYNEVADELVFELSGEASNGDGVQYDEKNIRRRVYDAINVLMAMNILAKEKKDIVWKGLPHKSRFDVDKLRAEKLQRIQQVDKKQAYLQELVQQQNALQHLLEKRREQAGRPVQGDAYTLPFIIIQSKPDASVEVQISDDLQDVQFDFTNSPFQIYDDSYVLRMMAQHDANKKRKFGAMIPQVYARDEAAPQMRPVKRPAATWQQAQLPSSLHQAEMDIQDVRNDASDLIVSQYDCSFSPPNALRN